MAWADFRVLATKAVRVAQVRGLMPVEDKADGSR